MPRRIIEVDGAEWEAAASGRVTQYLKDEFGLVFTRGTGPDREVRVVRYTPLGAKSRELALAELRRGKAPDDVVERALASVATPSHSPEVAKWLGDFLSR